jgi:ATP-dependent helicase/nuclease subunit A
VSGDLVDELARQRIRDDGDVTFIVEAGAGTGKTTALVGRVVRMVARGELAFHRLAAITFTEAAAAELRDRIGVELERGAIGQGPTEGLDDEARLRCRNALERFDDAAVTTLHGFANRLLAEHALAAGLPPRFEIADGVRASIDFRASWDRGFERILDDPDLSGWVRLGSIVGLKSAHLRGLARTFRDHPDRLAASRFDGPGLPAFDPSSVLTPLHAAIAERGRCDDESDRLAAHLDDLVPYVDTLARATDLLDLLDALANGSVPKLSTNLGKAKSWDGCGPRIKELLAEAEAARVRILTQARCAVIAPVAEAIREFTVDGARARKEEGTLEFQDLLVLARDLLRGHPEVRRAVAERYDHLLLDEFQDTDPLQMELALQITATIADDPATVVPGRLFVVGDPKQSIYRFRRADLRVYARISGELAGDALALRQNFRSVPGVIDWVNHVFTGHMASDDPGVQAVYTALIAARDPLPAAPVSTGCGPTAPGPVVAILGGATDADTVGEVRVHEGAAIANAVAAIVGDGWTVFDPALGVTRRARRSDVAILLPTRAALPTIEDALEAARIPARIESQSLVYASAEIRDLVAVLGAIDDPSDQVALVAALRSPAFACSDVALVEFHEAGGRWNLMRPGAPDLPADHPVLESCAALRALHGARWWRTVSATVDAVVRDRRLLTLALAHNRARDRWRRIRFFQEQARAFVEDGGSSLGGFLDWAREQAEEGARVVEMVVPEPDDDAVRILTIHGAKGLEFPIVVIAGLNADDDTTPPNVLWDADGRPEICIGPRDNRFTTAGADALLDPEAEAALAERARLLYVAATRARDHLLVSLFHKPKQRRTAAARLLPFLEGAPHVAFDPEPALDRTDRAESPDRAPEPAVVPGAVAAVPEPAPTDAPAPGVDAPLQLDLLAEPVREPARVGAPVAAPVPAWIARGRSATVAATRLAAHTETRVADADRADAAGARGAGDSDVEGDLGRDAGTGGGPGPVADDRDAKAEPDGPRRAWQRGRAGTAIGRAVHAVLQSVDLADPDGVAAIAHAQSLAEGIPGREREIERLARSALGAPIVAEAVAGGRFWREVPVATPIGDVIVEGFVDLLIETPAGLVVVDWKTDSVPDERAIDAAVERYTLQGAAYALVLEQVLGRPVVRCVFVFTRSPRALEREVTDLPAAVAEVRASIRHLQAAADG